MFYSQVVLARQSDLGIVWLAAHWGDKKISRPQNFAVDIPESVQSIMNPSVPLALRTSGHLLLGIVRIYSRKVKYVLQDSTEAIHKLQMAFTSAGHAVVLGTSDKTESEPTDLLQPIAAPVGAGSRHPGTGIGARVLYNFGDFDHVQVLQGFSHPLAETTEWTLAESDEPDLGFDSMLVTGTRASPGSGAMGGLGAYGSAEMQEPWAAFDSDDEGDNMMPADLLAHSRGSEIEMVRGAMPDSSMLSGASDPSRRDARQMSIGSVLLPPEEMSGDPQIPFEDDSSSGYGPNLVALGARLDDSSLNFDQVSRGRAGESVGGLDDSTAASKRSVQADRRRNKRRKVVIDEGVTELSDRFIQDMLGDAADLVQQVWHPVHLDEVEDDDAVARLRMTALASTLTWDQQITRPFISDDDRLAPEFKLLWQRNFSQALSEASVSHQEGTTEGNESIERGRAGVEGEGSVDSTAASPERAKRPDELFPFPEGDEGEDFGAMQFDDDTGDEQAPTMGADPETSHGGLESFYSPGGASLPSLGLASSFDTEGDETTRAPIGGAIGTSTKWHAHTIKVLNMLQRSIRNDSDELGKEEEEENAKKPTELHYNEISKNCSRQTAAGVFFELLLLKTFDFIELIQDDPYGDIAILAGNRFWETPAV